MPITFTPPPGRPVLNRDISQIRVKGWIMNCKMPDVRQQAKDLDIDARGMRTKESLANAITKALIEMSLGNPSAIEQSNKLLPEFRYQLPLHLAWNYIEE